MTVKEFRQAIDSNPDAKMHWMLPDKSFVPAHYHITEVGKVQKDFVDCGGTVRPPAGDHETGVDHADRQPAAPVR